MVKAGVVAVNRFVRAGDKKFAAYIDYMDRDDATRNEKFQTFDLFNDYMDKPDRSSGLFTDGKSEMTLADKKELKNIFRTAYENGSLMWQTVISFDHEWLKDHGVMDRTSGAFDEAKMKEVATGAIRKMLEAENLQNAAWSASFHYDTDNIHVHVGIVEPVPMRKQKEYVQYQYVSNPEGEYINLSNGAFVKANERNKFNRYGIPLPRYDRVPIIENGKIKTEMEYVGRFKQSSLEECKKYIVNQIIDQRENNILINRIIRDQIVKAKKAMYISEDQDLAKQFIKIHKALPRNCDRGLWKYNSNIIKPLQEEIDKLSDLYMGKYHSEDLKELKKILYLQSEDYRIAYGDTGRNFETNKMRELHERMGNAILAELREYDRKVTISDEEFYQQTLADLDRKVLDKGVKQAGIENSEGSEGPYSRRWKRRQRVKNVYKTSSGIHVEWNEEYKTAKKNIFGKDPDYQMGIKKLESQSEKKNILAVSELANIYQYGRGVDIDQKKAESLYAQTFMMYEELYPVVKEQEQDQEQGHDNTWLSSYILYKMGKQMGSGLGVEQDYLKAKEYFEKSGSVLAHFELGNMYFYGRGIEQDYEKALRHYTIATDDFKHKNPYAQYKIGMIYEHGLGMDISEELAQENYESAFFEFQKLENERGDDNTAYRLGVMLLKGKGCVKDKLRAEEYFQKSAKAGNAYAQYELAKIYLESQDSSRINQAIELLEKSADKGKNELAQFTLGKIYLQEGEFHDLKKAIQWLSKAADSKAEWKNPYAAYLLGKIYLDPDSGYYDENAGIKYMKMAAVNGNEYASYILGKVYLERTNVEDQKEGIAWMNQAAAAGNIMANYRLGVFYLDQTSPFYNQEDGLKQLEYAAEKDNSYAQLKLGILYLKGESVKQDFNTAKKYFQKSADNGNEYAKEILQDLVKNKGYKPRLRIRSRRNFHVELNRSVSNLKRALNNEKEKALNVKALQEYERKQKQEQAVE